jgi:hypothetical protein
MSAFGKWGKISWTVHDGLRGLRFVAKVVKSSRHGGKWLTL